MAAHTETFAGRSIKIGDDGSLHIAGKLIEYDHDPVTDTWSSRYLPYSRYESLLKLARAVISDTAEFIDTQS